MLEKQKIGSYLQTRFSQIFQPGLSLKQRVRLIPIIGYTFSWVNAILMLPKFRHHTALEIEILQREQRVLIQQGKDILLKLEQLDGHIFKHEIQIENHDARIANLELRIESHEVCLAKQEVHSASQILRIENVDARTVKLEKLRLSIRLEAIDALDIGKRLMQLDQLQLARQMKSIALLIRTHQTRENAVLARIQGLENAQHQPLQLSARTSADSPTDNRAMNAIKSFPDMQENDRFYVEFEALFRGQRADIKQRLQVYIPYLSHITSQTKKDRLLVIDVGCGRGEWLELLHENDIPAMGVDMNQAMVDACLSQGLLARCADAIVMLREQEAGSVGAVTGFHIIEHLPFERLLALFDAALHALCPGGVIIFETPNPENLKVGACNFYFDPTHLHPIVPQVAEFMAKQRGYSHAEILRLHPYPDDHLLHGGTAVEALLNKELFGPQDYAVIGRK